MCTHLLHRSNGSSNLCSRGQKLNKTHHRQRYGKTIWETEATPFSFHPAKSESVRKYTRPPRSARSITGSGMASDNNASFFCANLSCFYAWSFHSQPLLASPAIPLASSVILPLPAGWPLAPPSSYSALRRTVAMPMSSRTNGPSKQQRQADLWQHPLRRSLSPHRLVVIMNRTMKSIGQKACSAQYKIIYLFTWQLKMVMIKLLCLILAIQQKKVQNFFSTAIKHGIFRWDQQGTSQAKILSKHDIFRAHQQEAS